MIFVTVLVVILVVVETNGRKAAGPPGSSGGLPSHGGAPGSLPPGIGGLVFPSAPELAEIVDIGNLEEANEKHVYSDPLGPIGYVDRNGEFVPFRSPSSDRLKKNQQTRDGNTNWERVDTDTVNDNSLSNTPQVPQERSRAQTMYNIFRRRHQPAPAVPSIHHRPPFQPGPAGPPRY